MSAGSELREQAEEHQQRRLRRKLYVSVYAAGLAAVAVALPAAVGGIDHEAQLGIPWIVLALGFFAAEATALHIEVRRESHSVSLTGFPLLLGLLSLGPIGLITARLVGGGLALVLVRRRGGLKLIWNLCLFAAETAVAYAIAQLILHDGHPDQLLSWLVLLGAILAAEVVSLTAVALVIMVFEGSTKFTMFGQMARGQAIAAISSTFAIVVAAAMMVAPMLLALALLPILAVGSLLRVHGRLGRQHHDLLQLHTFTAAIAGRNSIDIGLEQLATILHTRGTLLAVERDDGGYTARIFVDDRHHDRLLGGRPIDSDIGQVVEVELGENDDAMNSLLQQVGGQRALAASVLDGVDEHAILMVFDRVGATEFFEEDQIKLFQSLARTLGTRLSADRLLDQLEIQAQVDDLTELANRGAFETALNERLSTPNTRGAVVVLDLDRFKDVNDSLGHQFGDLVLKGIAQRLSHLLGATSVAARLGGDEFAVLLDDVSSDEQLAEHIGMLGEHLGRPLELDGVTLDLGVSIGAATWPNDGCAATDLLRMADIAMYEAKRTHQTWVRYTPTIDHASPGRLRLMGALRDAIRDGQLDIHLQPQVRTGTLDVIGAEALVRWHHPELGMIPPGDFIPMAEQSGAAGDLTRFVINRALECARELHNKGVDLRFSVNLTCRDLLDRSLAEFVSFALVRFGLPGDRLTVEVTETSLIIDIEAAIANLSALRELGCRVSVDDFGTGHASLQYLQRLPIDEVKIDRSFVSNAATNSGDEAIVRSTTRLLRDLGLEVVAEGVEDTPTLALLRSVGCDAVQGYLTGRPVPSAEFVAMTAESNAVPNDPSALIELPTST